MSYDLELSSSLQSLARRAKDYAEAASSANTRRAYEADWRHFQAWCRREVIDERSADVQIIGLYLTACAMGSASVGGRKNAVSTIERRLAALTWGYRQLGQIFDRRDRHISLVMGGIRNQEAQPPRQKEAILPEDLRAMLEVCDRGTLRGLRDRAILLIGFSGGLRRSEITGLDLKRDQTEDGRGWVEALPEGLLLRLRGKTGWREVEIGKGSNPLTCPLQAFENWVKFSCITEGPLFRRIRGQGRDVGPMRLNDREVARIVQRCAKASGLRGDLPEADRLALFAGHSLRAGLASSAEVEERYIQKQLGHASAEMSRRYQRRRDRFRVNLTQAAGL